MLNINIKGNSLQEVFCLTDSDLNEIADIVDMNIVAIRHGMPVGQAYANIVDYFDTNESIKIAALMALAMQGVKREINKI